MKIWIDQFHPAPEGHRWCKCAHEAIVTMQNASVAIDRALRNGCTSFHSSAFGQTSADELRVEEISVSGEIETNQRNMLKMYIEELGKSDKLPIKTH